MDVRDLKFEDNTFDFCFSLSALEHMGNKKSKLKALKEIYRVLKPSGIFAMTTELVLNKLGWGRSYFRFEELQEICKNAGFEILGRELCHENLAQRGEEKGIHQFLIVIKQKLNL